MRVFGARSERGVPARNLVLILVALSSLAPVPLLAQAAARQATVVVAFDPAAGELPEGIALDDQGNIYLSMAPTSQLKRVTPRGEVSTIASLPDPSPGFFLGLAFRDGFVYGALASGDPATHGIWRVGVSPGRERAPERFAALGPGLPNGLAFLGVDLFVSDSALGTVWKINPGGGVSTWVEHPLLAGDPTGSLAGFPIGANGIAFRDGWLYAAITDYGRIARVRVQPDGTAGETKLFIEFPQLLLGADGITFDPAGNLLIAVAGRDSIVRVSPGGDVAVLAMGPPLSFPASLEVRDGAAWVTSFSVGALLGIVPGPATPALVRLPLD